MPTVKELTLENYNKFTNALLSYSALLNYLYVSCEKGELSPKLLQDHREGILANEEVLREYIEDPLIGDYINTYFSVDALRSYHNAYLRYQDKTKRPLNKVAQDAFSRHSLDVLYAIGGLWSANQILGHELLEN